MNYEEKLEQTKQNIWQAIKDYGKHTTKTDVLSDVSEKFVEKLARDSLEAKAELRGLFRKSPVWNEELDALVINGTRTHNTDYERVRELIGRIFGYRLAEYRNNDWNKFYALNLALSFFENPDPDEEDLQKSIDAIKTLAPKAYAANKRPSRIFLALCEALGVADYEKNSDFQRLFAQLADELSAKKIDFKLFVSVNPAHFITMSNPKEDQRGNTLTSCHSFNSTEYEYNTGCTGYARDNYTFIVFTAANPDDPESLNNRKTMRQIFAYKPGNGVLLQSRIYNTGGGVNGATAESKLYRDLIQREISALEDAANLWTTFRYYDNDWVTIKAGAGFGGYQDWTYQEFGAKVSIRADHENDFESFEIGTYGRCVKCGDVTNFGVYCETCSEEDRGQCCASCEEWFRNDDLYVVYDEDGNAERVCVYCRDNYYTQCEECDCYVINDDIRETVEGDEICSDCANRYYHPCDWCGQYERYGHGHIAVGNSGQAIHICDGCFEEEFTRCDDCGDVVPTITVEPVFNAFEEEIEVCSRCAPRYVECHGCGRRFSNTYFEHRNGMCDTCRRVLRDGQNDECVEEIA